jgi:DNA-binding MarR family transcriptional regulator
LDRAIDAAAFQPDTCAVRHIARASRAVMSAFDQCLAPVDLTSHQFNLLMTLARSGPLNIAALSARVGADPATISRGVAVLRRRRLVLAQRGDDRRRQVIAVSDDGRRRLIRALRRWEAAQRRVVGVVGLRAWRRLMVDLRSLSELSPTVSPRRRLAG